MFYLCSLQLRRWLKLSIIPMKRPPTTQTPRIQMKMRRWLKLTIIPMKRSATIFVACFLTWQRKPVSYLSCYHHPSNNPILQRDWCRPIQTPSNDPWNNRVSRTANISRRKNWRASADARLLHPSPRSSLERSSPRRSWRMLRLREPIDIDSWMRKGSRGFRSLL